MAVLDHENLHVYRCAIDFLTLSFRLLPRIPRLERDLRDQLKRAATSIPLNIAEGSGKPSVADRARSYAIARGSAMECGAIVDVLHAMSLLSQEEAQEAKGLLARIVGMLTKLCRG